MFQFLNYNYFSDGNALSTPPSIVDNITNIRIQNAIFNHFNITKNINTPVSSTIPTLWDYDTIFNADFNGTLNAGNVDFIAEQISAIKIKRRVQGEFNWLTIQTIPINSVEDLTFVFNDLLNKFIISSSIFSVDKARRSAVFSPIPGNFLKHSIRFSIVFG